MNTLDYVVVAAVAVAAYAASQSTTVGDYLEQLTNRELTDSNDQFEDSPTSPYR
jgi:hypothetical protein